MEHPWFCRLDLEGDHCPLFFGRALLRAFCHARLSVEAIFSPLAPKITRRDFAGDGAMCCIVPHATKPVPLGIMSWWMACLEKWMLQGRSRVLPAARTKPRWSQDKSHSADTMALVKAGSLSDVENLDILESTEVIRCTVANQRHGNKQRSADY